MKLVDNVRDDDVFLLLDADELPTAESLMFLKMFDGWLEPVKFGFRQGCKFFHEILSPIVIRTRPNAY